MKRKQNNYEDDFSKNLDVLFWKFEMSVADSVLENKNKIAVLCKSDKKKCECDGETYLYLFKSEGIGIAPKK